LRTEGASVGLDKTNEELLLDFISSVRRNPMALASLVGYLRTVQDVYTFEDMVGRGKLFEELDEYQHAEDRTKYLIKKQIAAQSDELKILLCALAFFDRPLPVQALEVFLPDRAGEHIARLSRHNLANLIVGARGTRRYELHSFFSELTHQDEFYDRFLFSLDEDLAASFLVKGNAEYEATYFRRAIDLYDCAIAIYEPLARQRPEIANDLAGAYMNKGVALDSLGRLEDAIAEYDKAIAIREPLAKQRPEIANDLAMAYTNKGNALSDNSKWADALAYYNQATQLWVALILKDKRLELLPLWLKVNRLGLLPLAKLKRWEAAAAKIIEVIDLYGRLMQSGQLPNPDAAQQEFAQFIYTLRQWPKSDRKKVYKSAREWAEVLREVMEE
ncbi:MAG TPA: tetratricopeptide repeat protein, partial [Blastocatellia bacterium]|nr:tetratricopeptide repeat protein [Blastocatellia bacterium]